MTGESGSGKSTLINEILYQGLSNIKIVLLMEMPLFEAIEGAEYVDKIVNIDQQPIGENAPFQCGDLYKPFQ